MTGESLLRTILAIERGAEAQLLMARTLRLEYEQLVREVGSDQPSGASAPPAAKPKGPEDDETPCGCPPKWEQLIRGTTKTRCTNPECPKKEKQP